MQLLCSESAKDISGPSCYVNDRLKEECHRLAAEAIAALCPLPREYIFFALHEFLKNVLHGENATVIISWLPDGSLLLIATDRIGVDSLDPHWCFGLATSMIKNAIGEDNYITQRNGNVFESYLRIPASKYMTEAQ